MKEFLGIIAVVLSIIGFAPYILDILRNKTKPHIFTWVIWTTTTFLVFLGQWQKGGGAGSWTTGITGILSILVTILAFKRGSKDITLSDKVFFTGALITIIPWILTKDPTFSIIILTFINVSAFIPTIRKTINNPASETFITYFLNIFRHGLSIIALANYNLATYLFPSIILLMNIIMVLVIVRPKRKNKF